MNRIFTAIVLLLIAGSAFADTGALANSKTFVSHLAPPESDYSVAYLGEIFGTVGNVLQGGSGQILGKMFDVFNKGLIAVAALFLGYTTITTVLSAATEGSFMTQNKKIHFTLLRVAFGFALVIPSSTTGYSMLQSIYMKIVIEGVGLADKTWDTALQYIQYGGKLYIRPAKMGNDTGIIAAMVSPTSGTTGPASQIFQDEVCMFKSKMWQKEANGLDSSSSHVSDFRPVYDEKNGYIYFPGVGNWNSTTHTMIENSDCYNGSTTGSCSSGQQTAACGSAQDYYSIDSSTTAGSAGTNSAAIAGMTAGRQDALKQYSYSAMKQLVLSLLPVARSYADNSGAALPANPGPVTLPALSGLTTKQDANVKSAFSAVLAYMNLITPYQNAVNSTAANGLTGSSFSIAAAEKQGWITAGGFYWAVERTNNSSAAASVSAMIPAITAPTTSNWTATTALADAAPYINTLWNRFIGAQENNIGANGDQSNGSNQAMASSPLSTVVSSDFELQDAGDYNPIIAVMDEGKRMLDAVVAMWSIAIAISVGASVAAGVCDSTSPGWAILRTSLIWVKSLLMLFTTMLLGPGVILGYYVPLYPFAVFTFAAVGWFALVIEGMAAAPLVCLGMTHPEGHDFLGKGEQALMLFLSIFLRPALMIIGLIAAMVVSFVAFRLLIGGFNNVLSSLYNSNKGAFQQDFLIAISECMVLVIFGMLTMELIEQCYKLIYQLPNNIMQWIGGPRTGDEYGQGASKMQGTVSAGASAGGKGMEGLASADGSGMQDKEGKGNLKKRYEARKAAKAADIKTDD